MSTFKENFLKIAGLPLVFFLVNEFVNRNFTWWYTHYGVDSFFHYTGGISIAFGLNYILQVLDREKLIIIKRKPLKAFSIISTTAFVAVLWEIYEFIWDLSFGTHFQPSNFDTMKDLILGTFGAFSFCLVYFLWLKPADGSGERNALPDVLGTSHPTNNSLKSDTETGVRH